MPELILILLKINMVLLLFAAAYYLVLRRLTFYTINRAFLIIGIVFSSVYPFINLTNFFNRQEDLNPAVKALVPRIDMDALLQHNAIMAYWQLAVVLFYVGVGLMAIRLIAQFVSLYRVHKRSQPGVIGDLPVRILNGPLSPFSFWQTVYVNPTIHSAKELDTILAHEQVHVKEWHTLDIILAEISVVFYWFNPGVWLMKRAIKENIEFITDSKILKRGIDKKAYQYSLLGVGNLQASAALVNNFNLSDLKKRIKMMNTKKSSSRKLLIYAFILPLLLLTTLAFTVSKKDVKTHLMPLTKVLAEVTHLELPVAKTAAIVTKPVVKRKVHIKDVAVTGKRDTLNISYVVRAVMIKGDSAGVTKRIPDEVLDKLSKFRLNDIKIAGQNIAFKYTDTLVAGKSPTAERVHIIARKQGYPVNNEVSAIVVRGFKTPAKGVDSVKLNVNYVVNGKPISADELSDVNPSDIKTVTLKKLAQGKGEMRLEVKKP
jgi:hypothetical protein